jgi:alpha-mannosidase
VVDPQLSRNTLLPVEASFFSVDKPNISISSIKKAEDENETVIRLFETGTGGTKINLRSWFRIQNASKTTMIEYDSRAIEYNPESVPLEIGSHSVETLKLGLQK